MVPKSNQLVRPVLEKDIVLDALRGELQGGKAGVTDVLCSERQLAKRFNVSRITVRRALKQLVSEGYLVNQPRKGYAVTARAGQTGAVANGVIAYVLGTTRSPWHWTPFMTRLERDIRLAASEAGRDLLVVARGDDSTVHLAQRLAAMNLAGAIVDSDNVDVSRQLKAAGISVVGVDTAHDGVDSISQDNFSGAFQATRYLIERYHRRVALVGFNPYSLQSLHARERLGGYLSALTSAGLTTPAEWRIFTPAEKNPGAALARLVAAEDGPTAAVVLWPEVLDDVGHALSGCSKKCELVAWWGAVPETRERWGKQFPGFPIPAGVTWSTREMACAALARLDELTRGIGLSQAKRMLIPVQWIPGQ